jgi:flagellar export protein FliJ
MKKFRFRLERVRDVQAVSEQRARARVRTAQAVATDAAGRLEASAKAYENHEFDPGPIPFIHHRMDRTMWELRATAVQRRAEELREAEDQVRAATTEWVATKQDLDVLERLEERQREEYRIELDRAEQRDLDDRPRRTEEDDDDR